MTLRGVSRQWALLLATTAWGDRLVPIHREPGPDYRVGIQDSASFRRTMGGSEAPASYVKVWAAEVRTGVVSKGGSFRNGTRLSRRFS